MYFKAHLCCVCVCLIIRQWLEDAMKENDPSSVLLFLVGTKKDLSVCVVLHFNLVLIVLILMLLFMIYLLHHAHHLWNAVIVI